MFKQHFPVFSYFLYFCPPLGPTWGQVNLGMRINASSLAPLGAILAPPGAISAQFVAILAQLGGILLQSGGLLVQSGAISAQLGAAPVRFGAALAKLIASSPNLAPSCRNFVQMRLRLAPSGPDLGSPALPFIADLSYFKKMAWVCCLKLTHF